MFFLSLFMVFISSWFITSVFSPSKGKSRCAGVLILLISMFAQIVLTFEILSLFSAINSINVLSLNAVFFALSGYLWFKQGKPVYLPEVKETFKRIWCALKKDKILMIMAFGMAFFIIVTILLNVFMPVLNYDALTYHLNRAAFWMSQGNLNHFDIADDRNLIMPINSEILYLWVLVFLKKDIGLFFFSFFGYIASVFSVYNILGYFNFSERRKLWSIFILSSFASVIAEASSLETDIFIAGLILSSILLFLISLKEKKISMIFFSSLAYALATGTKTPAVIAFPAVFLLLAYFAFKKEKTQFYKPLGIYLGFLFINFLIFSSYNYILNFIDYGNFFGSEAARKVHGFRGGFKALVANYIRYIFMLFDFSGFRYSDYVGEHITNARTAILSFLHIPQNLGVEMPDNNIINNRLLEVKMGTGLLGFLLFLPSAVTAIILAVIKKLQNKPSEKISALFAFGAMFFVNIFCLSFSIAYMVFSIRFVSTLVVISSPVLALSYMKKNSFIKLLILFFVMSYFLVMSVNLSSRPLANVIKVIRQEKTLGSARERIRCSLLTGYVGKMSFCYLRDIIRTTPEGSSFGIFSNHNSRLYVIKMLENEGYKIDTLLAEKAEEYDLNKYDYLIKTDSVAISSLLVNKTEDTKVNYKFDEKGNALISGNEDYICVYVDHDTHTVYNPEKKNQTVYVSHCIMSHKFFKKKGFDFVKSYNFRSDVKDNANFMTIYKKESK